MRPKGLKYSRNHVWVKAEGDMATVGVTDYAQSELGDIVYVELPKPGENVQRGDVLGTVESVKTVSDITAPISGKIVRVNDKLPETPEVINDDPYDSGWIAVIEMQDTSELCDLMSDEEYDEFISQH